MKEKKILKSKRRQTFLSFCLFAAVFNIFNLVKAQNKSLICTGTLSIKDIGTIPYELLLRVDGEKLSGESISDRNGKSEVRSKLEGLFIPEKKKLFIAETKIISSKSKQPSTELCFVNAQLNVRYQEDQLYLAGSFIGRKKDGKSICGTGTIQLKGIDSAKQFTTTTAELTQDTSLVLTGGAVRTIDWKSSQLKFEMWDGGKQDGDSVMILRNDDVLVNARELAKQVYSYEEPWGNTKEIGFTIKALNEGKRAPNTASFTFSDGKKTTTLALRMKEGEEVMVRFRRKQ